MAALAAAAGKHPARPAVTAGLTGQPVPAVPAVPEQTPRPAGPAVVAGPAVTEQPGITTVARHRPGARTRVVGKAVTDQQPAVGVRGGAVTDKDRQEIGDRVRQSTDAAAGYPRRTRSSSRRGARAPGCGGYGQRRPHIVAAAAGTGPGPTRTGPAPAAHRRDRLDRYCRGRRVHRYRGRGCPPRAPHRVQTRAVGPAPAAPRPRPHRLWRAAVPPTPARPAPDWARPEERAGPQPRRPPPDPTRPGIGPRQPRQRRDPDPHPQRDRQRPHPTHIPGITRRDTLRP